MAFGVPDPEVGVVIANPSDEDSGGSSAPESLSISEDLPKWFTEMQIEDQINSFSWTRE